MQRRRKEHMMGDKMSQNNRGGRLQLYTYGQLPRWYQQIMEPPYITAGYRNNLSYRQCLRSIFQIHNETGNIWTSLLPAIVFLLLAYYDITVSLPGAHGNGTDYVVIVLFHLCFQIGAYASTYFHTFHAQGCRQKYEECLAVDLWGLAVSSASAALQYVAYAFCCSWQWQAFYCVSIGGLITWYSVIWLHPKMVPGWVSVRRRFLAFFPLYIVLYGVMLLQPLYLNRHWPDNLPQTFVLLAVPNCAILLAGIVVYVMKIPERWWPGCFNFWGHSHQWWHLLLVAAQLFWRRTIIIFMQMKLHTLC
ncbi:progestin and adipoQ receptor family member 3-like [Branchiostoma floridae x Branchiostoma japonicum]